MARNLILLNSVCHRLLYVAVYFLTSQKYIWRRIFGIECEHEPTFTFIRPNISEKQFSVLSGVMLMVDWLILCSYRKLTMSFPSVFLVLAENRRFWKVPGPRPYLGWGCSLSWCRWLLFLAQVYLPCRVLWNFQCPVSVLSTYGAPRGPIDSRLFLQCLLLASNQVCV